MREPTCAGSHRLAAGLLILRLTLGLFLLQWALEKFIVPTATVRIAQGFYGVTLPPGIPMVLGGLELVLVGGVWRDLTYAVALIVHGVTTIVSWRQLLDPWGLAHVGGHLWIATTPVLGGFIALYLMRAWDGYSAAEWWRAREARRAP